MPYTPKKIRKRPWVEQKVAHSGRKNVEGFDYNCVRWRRNRIAHLRHVDWNCKVCVQLGIYGTATVSDHIDPINDGGDPWDWNNRQGLCKTHHDQKSGRESSAAKKKEDGKNIE